MVLEKALRPFFHVVTTGGKVMMRIARTSVFIFLLSVNCSTLPVLECYIDWIFGLKQKSVQDCVHRYCVLGKKSDGLVPSSSTEQKSHDDFAGVSSGSFDNVSSNPDLVGAVKQATECPLAEPSRSERALSLLIRMWQVPREMFLSPQRVFNFMGAITVSALMWGLYKAQGRLTAGEGTMDSLMEQVAKLEVLGVGVPKIAKAIARQAGGAVVAHSRQP